MQEDNNFTSENNPEEDEFVIGKGFEINEYEEPLGNSKHSKKPRKKTNSVTKTIIWVVAIVVISVGIALGVIYTGADYLGMGFGRGEDCVMEIQKGSSTEAIAQKLNDANAVRLPVLFRLYSKLKHYDGQYKYGVYTFNNEIGYAELAKMLMTEGALSNSVRVKIPEAGTIDDMAKVLEEKGVCTKDDFIDEVQNGKFDYDFVESIPSESVYYRLEGYLFPDTYDFYNYDSKECAHLAVDKMLKATQSKLDDDIMAKINSGKYSLHEVMTMASIVELEAGGSPDEAANVAAVFYNRLNSSDFSTLGSSPTRKYPHGDGRYDTYTAKGLPPGPLCAPSAKSINAAVNPTPNFDYYYFVTDASMKFYYNKTISQHNAIIAKLKAEKNWIYED